MILGSNGKSELCMTMYTRVLHISFCIAHIDGENSMRCRAREAYYLRLDAFGHHWCLPTTWTGNGRATNTDRSVHCVRQFNIHLRISKTIQNMILLGQSCAHSMKCLYLFERGFLTYKQVYLCLSNLHRLLTCMCSHMCFKMR